MTRNAGFMLPEQPSDLRKRFFLGVIEAEPLLYLRLEAFERRLQCPGERSDVALAMRIAGLHLRSEQRPRQSFASFVFSKLLEAAPRADGINVPLGKNGTEAGLQRTSPMEVAKARTFHAFAASQTVQFGKKRIRKITSFRGTRVAAKNRGRRRA